MIKAKIIKDSVSHHTGKRITTFELEFHRFILAEFNTHRALARNSASSRAIPLEKFIENITTNPAIPVWWGKNQSGMQAKEELPVSDQTKACEIWLEARDAAIQFARQLGELGLHKQIVNRLLEPWTVTKVIATATDWDNFFFLRNHPDAQPEIHLLADLMVQEYLESKPQILSEGEWHLPYVDSVLEQEELKYFSDGQEVDLETAKKISGSMCAQVSFRKSDTSIEKACNIYDRLVGSVPKHSSPFEHQATPAPYSDEISGNLRGWIQLRKLMKDDVCEDYFGACSQTSASPS